MGGCDYPDGVYAGSMMPHQWVVWFQGVPWLIDKLQGGWERRQRFRGSLDMLEDIEYVDDKAAYAWSGLPGKVLA